MAEPAIRRTNAEEFLRWEDGTDTRYESVDGFPVAMGPPAQAHGIVCVRLAGEPTAALRSRRPCTAQAEAAIARRDRNDSCYITGLAIPAAPIKGGDHCFYEGSDLQIDTAA
jgi:Uma2 family endonuclease